MMYMNAIFLLSMEIYTKPINGENEKKNKKKTGISCRQIRARKRLCKTITVTKSLRPRRYMYDISRSWCTWGLHHLEVSSICEIIKSAIAFVTGRKARHGTLT